MQGRSRMDRELLDAEAIAGDLVPDGSVFAFLASHRHELFPGEFTADLFPSRTGPPVAAGGPGGIGAGAQGAV